MTDGRYNYIFSALANDEDDILGQLAYSVYKRQKIEYIKAFKARNGFEPQDADLIAFHDISNSHSQLESYRTQAARLAKDFLDSCMSAESEELATFYAAKANSEISSARPGFWKGVSQSVIGSACFIMLLGCLVFFTWSLKQGPRQVIEQVFDVMIVDVAPTNTAVALDAPQP